MTLLPKTLFRAYLDLVKKNEVPVGFHSEYVKWLRYYLDFCEKYVVAIDESERLRLFLGKLREKKQSDAQCKRAEHAVTLYFELRRSRNNQATRIREPAHEPYVTAKPALPPQSFEYQRKSQYVEAGYQEKTDSPEWDAVLEAMAAEIKVRHYSRKTLKTYGKWSRSFQRFLKNKSPQAVSTEDVKGYLTYLAVKCKVAASTQNQAFNVG